MEALVYKVDSHLTGFICLISVHISTIQTYKITEKVEAIVAQRHAVSVTVVGLIPSRGYKIFNIFITRFSNEAKRGVEFANSMPQEIGEK